MLAWTAIQAQQKKAEEAAKRPTTASTKPSPFKTAALLVAAPFIGLAYVIAGPILGLGLLIWFGLQAWGKLGAKALAGRPQVK